MTWYWTHAPLEWMHAPLEWMHTQVEQALQQAPQQALCLLCNFIQQKILHDIHGLPWDRLAPGAGQACAGSRTGLRREPDRLAPGAGQACAGSWTGLRRELDRLAPGAGQACAGSESLEFIDAA